MNYLYIVLGAAVGAPLRFAIDQYIRKFTDKPYGIFLVNVLGSFIIGLTFKESEAIYDLMANWICWRFHNLVDIYARHLPRVRAKALSRNNHQLSNVYWSWPGSRLPWPATSKLT